MEPNDPISANDFSLPNPHDAFFRAAFSNPQVATDLFRQFLPVQVAGAIDWGSLASSGESYLDSDLRTRYADLLFSANLGKSSCLLYLLLEHKSAPDYWARFQLLELITRIWRRVIDQGESRMGKLPLIIPMIVYQGSHPWPYPRDLVEMIDTPNDLRSLLAPVLPNFEHFLVDLSELDWEFFRGRARYRIAMRILKAVSLQRGWQEIARLGKIFDALDPASNPMIFLQILGKYLLEANQIIDLSTFDAILRKLPETEPKEVFMSLREQIEAKGRQEGRRETILETIDTLNQALGHAPLTSEQCSSMSLPELERILQGLKRELAERLK